MEFISIQYFDSSYGELILGSFNESLCLCDWRYRNKRTSIDSRIKSGLDAEFIDKDDVVLKEARRQLDEYFNRKRKKFDIPLLMVGTPFQERVWNGLLKIPFGKTLSYQQLAEDLGSRNAVRAVANANGANALSIFVPCHRIVGSNGNLVGYAGGVEVKAKLLNLEFDLFV
ncbi:MAG: methylated-DNA--[protein]-cysteine S-methyltransferase [Arenicellales bacterium]|nr:methylated-DNA--[protein]-cysteine S-methyltransferase [Arenicellales bacterium]